ncbi:TPA: helix-turn-helix domain-containing protein [Bacillus cereus]|nr:helix-turn-helix transcriptional regulator [Bacillus cereus]
MLRSNLKEVADERGISIRQLSREIDYAYEVVRRMYNDEMERYPRDLLGKLCSFLNVTPNDLLIIEQDAKKED